MKHSILGLDLATRRYRDIGIAIVQEEGEQINCHFLRPARPQFVDPPTVASLAAYIDEIANEAGVTLIAIDGPQAWKAPANGLQYQRVSEKALHTQAKTGLPGSCKPASSLRFVQFAIDFYGALEERGWQRQRSATELAEKTIIEVFPTAAWRALGCKPLPAKPACSAERVSEWLARLNAIFPLSLAQSPTHDELQAVMAGMVGLAFGHGSGYCSYGVAPFLSEGYWREGFIVNLCADRQGK